MDKGKQNKSRNEPHQNVVISEPDFSVKSETLSPAEKKLRAQQERERKDAEEAALLKQKQIAEQKKKNTKTKSKQKNKQTKQSEPDVDISKQEVNEVNEVNDADEVNEVNEEYEENLQEISLKEQETNNFLEKTDPSWNWTSGGNTWRSKRENVSKPNYSTSSFNTKRSTGSYSYNFNDGKNDKDFQKFLKHTARSSGKVREEIGDLFHAPEDYSLAHCVAEDFKMGAGIAKEFKAKFKSVAELLEQRASTGGLAFLEHDSRFIYYLVTKKVSRGKPTLYTLWQSLLKMYEHIVANNVTKLAIPQIGCGLDRLDWNEVKRMLEYIFKEVDIDIVVYILEYNATETATPSRPFKKCVVVHDNRPLVEITTETGLIFLGSEDGFVTPEIKSLETKYDFVPRYKNANKKTGDVIKIVDRNEYLYGLIVKRNQSDFITFSDFERCLHALQKLLKQDKTEYIGIQGFVEKGDEVITDKLVNLMQYHLKDVEIWVCWPNELAHLCPTKK